LPGTIVRIQGSSDPVLLAGYPGSALEVPCSCVDLRRWPEGRSVSLVALERMHGPSLVETHLGRLSGEDFPNRLALGDERKGPVERVGEC
jgi:hypothetical protein